MPHVKSTLYTFLIHHFACIKFNFPLKNFYFPHKTFYFPTNISFPTIQNPLSFSLSLSYTHTHTHTDLDIHIHTHTHKCADANEEKPAQRCRAQRRQGWTQLSLPTSHTHRRPISSAVEPNADKAGSQGFRWWKAYVHRSSVAVAGAVAFSSSRLRCGDPKALLSSDRFNRR